MNQDPSDMSVYNSIITLPWCFKIIFGIISDTVPLYGLYRKPYLIIMAYVQFAFMLTLFFYDYDDATIVTLLLFLTSFASAFSDVVFDALIVVQSRKDVVLGS